MNKKESHLPRFNDAVEAFKGYPCFDKIPDKLFRRIAEIIEAQEVGVYHARDRISQVIWQDQVENSKRRLTPEDKEELSGEIRKEVGLKLECHEPGKVVKLVQPAG